LQQYELNISNEMKIYNFAIVNRQWNGNGRYKPALQESHYEQIDS